MKKLLLFAIAIGIGLSVLAQYRSVPVTRNVTSTQNAATTDLSVPGEKPATILDSGKNPSFDPEIMKTYYDNMTNASMGESHLVLFSDGSMSAAATFSLDAGGTWPGRGTGYNHSSDGVTWGARPTTRIESIRTGWGQIQPWGEAGECVLAHQNDHSGLVFSKSVIKGSGIWTESIIPSPAGATGMLWPRMITTGPNYQTIHVIALTAPTANNGTLYNGMDGALLYMRSTDGGTTWSDWQQLPGMTASEYIAMYGDNYGWAAPRGDTICFVHSGCFSSTFLMKSTDGGDTWTKTVIYQSDYDLIGVTGNSLQRFYTSDGVTSVILDNQGIAHVTFGLMCDSLSGSTTYNYWPYTHGLVYWNENMDQLDPSLDPDLLYENGQLAAWVEDTNVFYNDLADYSAISMTSMSSMSIDENNNLLVVWTMPLSDQIDPNQYMIRHIFGRTAMIEDNGNVIWNDQFSHLNTELEYYLSECVWPSLAMTSDEDNYYMIFMWDDLAGNYINSLSVGAGYRGQTNITDNFIYVKAVAKGSVGIGKEKQGFRKSFSVSQNFPNPVSGTTNIVINTTKAGNLTITVSDVSGKNVISDNYNNITSGSGNFTLDCSSLSSGIYFYTVTMNNESITRKLVVN